MINKLFSEEIYSVFGGSTCTCNPGSDNKYTMKKLFFTQADCENHCCNIKKANNWEWNLWTEEIGFKMGYVRNSC